MTDTYVCHVRASIDRDLRSCVNCVKCAVNRGTYSFWPPPQWQGRVRLRRSTSGFWPPLLTAHFTHDFSHMTFHTWLMCEMWGHSWPKILGQEWPHIYQRLLTASIDRTSHTWHFTHDWDVRASFDRTCTSLFWPHISHMTEILGHTWLRS